MRKRKGYWNVYENAEREAKKYKTRFEFQKSCNGAYQAARKNGWLKDYTWFKEPRKFHKPSVYWNKEKSYQEALKYKTRSEFQKGCVSAYNAAWKNKWLDDYTWFVNGRIKTLTDKNDSVYKYVFSDGAIYIGRTLMRRQNERVNEHQADTDTVGKYAKENGLAIPPMEIIEENITPIEGLEREDFWVNYYKEKGYNVINKAKTGIGSGSLGAIDFGKWNKENVFAEAKKYKTRSEFQKGCQSAYYAAWRKGWLSEMFEKVRKPRGYWNKKTVFEEARKYQSRTEFQKGSQRAYQVAWKNGWLKEMDWFEEGKKSNGYWQNKEIVFAEARKYKTRSDFRQNASRAYILAWKNNWLDILFPAKKVA